MNHGSLFSGIGGFDLAAEWMGWNNIFHCEKNEFCQTVLNYYWPNAIVYDDITKTDFSIHRGSIDILTGGFPCQPYSTAGKRKGKEDDRHLWPEMLRAIQEIKPLWIVGENVRGIISWNGGMVFNEVCSELENEGYEVQSFVLPAASVNAPHQRYRLFIVAHLSSEFDRQHKGGTEKRQEQKSGKCFSANDDTNPNGKRSPEWIQSRKPGIQKTAKAFKGGELARTYSKEDWRQFPTESPIYTGDDGVSTELDGTSLSKIRKKSIQGSGNAVVPKLVYQIFKVIDSFYCA